MKIKTKAKWESLGMVTVGPATHQIEVHGDKISMWSEEAVKPKYQK